MCSAAGQEPHRCESPRGQRWVMPAAAGAFPSGLKLLTPVPPRKVGKSQHEMFSNSAEHGSAFAGKWQRGPDVSQGN